MKGVKKSHSEINLMREKIELCVIITCSKNDNPMTKQPKKVPAAETCKQQKTMLSPYTKIRTKAV